MRALIVEDNVGSLVSLAKDIRSAYADIEIVGRTNSVKETLAFLAENKIDIAFMDIKLGSETSFDILKKLSSIDFQIIFITAYDEFAVKAFEYCAIDYILKPYSIERLRSAVQKLKKNFTKKDQRFEELFSSLQQGDAFKKIALPVAEGIEFINLMSIIRLEADDNYTLIYTTDGEKITSSKTLKCFEDIFPKEYFFRIHRAHFVNLHHVKKYVKSNNGQVVMSNGDRIEVAKRRKENFLQLLPGFNL